MLCSEWKKISDKHVWFKIQKNNDSELHIYFHNLELKWGMLFHWWHIVILMPTCQKPAYPLFPTSSIHYDCFLNSWQLNNLGPPLEFQRKQNYCLNIPFFHQRLLLSSLQFFSWMPLQRIEEDFQFWFCFIFCEDSAADTWELYK